eukprot:CAMPEP_0167797522 /NCGR_PEP_ID=MMETSP0111_2-20121227/15713_1 /TAXON_ID=91324 /ORGANISM="Lotharella globosa, Strain CCCM811" /LENGTH=144 /DNA_ID=CAMNT_0007691661 /DNA_START=170 /DNA_END=604 /DNA_ORIENTATION=+
MALTDVMLRDFFSDACKRASIEWKEDPVLDVFIQPPNKFCFVEFRSVSLTLMALERLKGLTLADTTLKIAKPKDFAMPPNHLSTFVCTGPKQVMPTPTLTPASSMVLGQLSVADQVAKAKAQAALRIAEVKAHDLIEEEMTVDD